MQSFPVSENHLSAPVGKSPGYDAAVAEQDAEFMDKATAWIGRLPNERRINPLPLQRPVAIPRITITGRFAAPPPFQRAYSPELGQYDVQEREFVAFIDNLSVAQAPPAPLKALNVAGRVVGFVPHPWASMTGTGINVAAGVSTTAVVYGRTRHFLEKSNREYFAPRGLQVSLCKHEKLVEKLGCRADSMILVEPDSLSGVTSVQDRRMYALRPYIAELVYDVPPSVQERNAIDQLTAKSNEKQRKKVDKKNWEHSSDSNSSSSSSSSSDSDDETHKTTKRIREINREAKKETKKHPSRSKEIEEKRARKVHELAGKMEAYSAKPKKPSKKAVTDLRQVKKMEFLVVEALGSAQHTAAMNPTHT